MTSGPTKPVPSRTRTGRCATPSVRRSRSGGAAGDTGVHQLSEQVGQLGGVGQSLVGGRALQLAQPGPRPHRAQQPGQIGSGQAARWTHHNRASRIPPHLDSAVGPQQHRNRRTRTR